MNRKNLLGMSPSSVSLGVVCALAMMMLSMRAASAMEWAITPIIGVSETYTDNVDLSQDEEEEFITTLDPGVTIRGTGTRTTVDVDYRASMFFYANNSDDNTVLNTLQADNSNELLRELLFLDLRATTDQTLIDPDLGFGSDFAQDNTTDVTTASVTPRLMFRLGSVAFNLDHTRSVIEYEEEFEDSVNDETNVLVRNAFASSRLQWSLAYENREFDYDEQSDVRFESATAELRYNFSSALAVFVNGGYERNEYEVPDAEEDPEGSSWLVGTTWTPSSRTTAEVAAGERFFGAVGYLTLRRGTPQDLAEISYTQDLTTTAEQILDDPVFLRENTIGQPIDEGQLPVGADPAVRVAPDAFIERELNMRYSKLQTTNQLTFEIYGIDREFQTTLIDERVAGFDAIWIHGLIGWAQFEVTSSFEEILERSDDPAVEGDRLWDIFLGYRKRFGARTEGLARIGHRERESDEADNGYRENELFLSLTATF